MNIVILHNGSRCIGYTCYTRFKTVVDQMLFDIDHFAACEQSSDAHAPAAINDADACNLGFEQSPQTDAQNTKGDHHFEQTEAA